MNKKNIAILAVVILSAVVAAFYLWPRYDKEFAGEISKCNIAPRELRFSCYRSVFENFYKDSPTELFSAVKNDESLSFVSPDSSYAIFGTNCHTFYHALGDFIATHTDEPLESKVGYCPTSCTGGCVMGLYKRTALIQNFSEDILKNLFPACPEALGHQCAHEIGHLLHDKYVVSILKILDDISNKEYDLKRAFDYSYTTFQNPDLNAPFEDCKKLVPDKELVHCYTGIGHNLFLFSEFSPEGYKALFRECNEKTDDAHKSDCYAFLVYRIGINDAATKFLSGDFESGTKICNEVVALSGRPELKKHCYLGIGGGIGLFVDSEFANVKVTDDNVTQLQKLVLEKINLCENSEPDFKNDCYKGLLGTRLRKLYKELNIQQKIIEEILPKIESDFEVVG